MNRTRPYQFSFHADADEAAKIRSNVQKCGGKLQSYLLKLALKECFTLGDVEAFVDPIISQIHCVGNNVNQIAELKNSVKTWSRTDLKENFDAMRKIMDDAEAKLELTKEDIA